MTTARQRRTALFAAGLAGAAGLVASYGVLTSNARAPQLSAAVMDTASPAPAERPATLAAPASTSAPEAVSAAVATDPIVTAAIAPAAPAPPPASTPEASVSALSSLLTLIEAGDAATAFAEAAALPSPLERQVGQWAAIYYGNGQVPLDSVQAFTADAPDFASGSIFRTRFEQAVLRSKPDHKQAIVALGGSMPRTLSGQILLAEAYAATGQTERAAGIARTIWTSNFLDKDGEQKLLAALGGLLTPADHWERAVYLMMHDRATAAERLSAHLTPAQLSLMEARNATSRQAKDARALLDKVDASMTGHPLYLFSRAQRAAQAGLLESAVNWLGKQVDAPPEAAEWWYLRRNLVRQLLDKGEVALAYRAADDYRHGPDGRLVEAHFHAGWIAFSFLKDSASATRHFKAMDSHSTLPDSVTQANYWLARALKAQGDTEGASAALRKAAAHPNVYYGLLARAELGETGAKLRELPDWQPVEPLFEARTLVRAIRALAGAGESSRALPLLRLLYPTLDDAAELVLAARLAQDMGAHNLAITIADHAEQRGMPLDLYSFPRDALPPSFELASVDRAVVFAVTRQESRFQTDAISSAGARGLMQLMPGTARETADKLGLEYSKERLTSDPEYNAQLGSAYIKAQLERFDGSLVLAAAAYNAGAGNANKWIAAYGDPRSPKVDPVLWVELIPFQETRLYVKRVLGNYMVYRARAGDTRISLPEALRRIEH